MILYRPAGADDVNFIAEAITESDKSGTDILSYARLFGLSDVDAQVLIKKAVRENIPGQELCLSGFLIAMIGNEPSGAVCSWLEAEDGIPSSVLKANILYYFLGKNFTEKSKGKSVIVDSLAIQREAGCLQIESVYVRNKFRGMGVSNNLILEQIKQNIFSGKVFSKVQIQLMETNTAALKSYDKLGFKTRLRKTSEHPEVLNYFPSRTKIMMELSVQDLVKKGLI